MDLHTLLAAANFIEYENKDLDSALKANISEPVGTTAHIKSDKINNNGLNVDETTYLAERHNNQHSFSDNTGHPEFQVSSHGMRSGLGDTPSKKPQESESNAYSSLPTVSVTSAESLPAQQYVSRVMTSESGASYDDYPDSPKPLQIVDVTAPSMDVLVARARMAIVSTTVDSDQTRNSPSATNRYTPTKDNARSDVVQSTVNTEQARKSPQGVGRRVRETGAHSTPVNPLTPLNPSGKKENGQNVNTLLPSLIQTSEDEKVYAALQFKQMKRNVTLTHNQLEKNRRAHLKERFEALKSCIPRLGMRRSSNLTILKAALRHIETLKKKASEHQQSLEALKSEKQEKIDRLVALKNELLEQASSKIIDSYLEESLSNGGGDCTEDTASIASVQTTGELEDDQQSTSTASEAEEEEIKAAANRGRAHQFRSPDFSRDIVIYPPPTHAGRPQPQPAPVMRPPSASSNPAIIAQSPVVLAQPKQQQHQFQQDKPQPPPYTEAKRVYVNGSQKSPVKLYGTPSGRSATPSPPSNCVSFFPRFNIGSGGSPPLHSSNDILSGAKPPQPTVFASQKFASVRKGSEPQAAAAVAPVTAGVLNPVYQVLSSYAMAQPGVAAKAIMNTKTDTEVIPNKLVPATDTHQVCEEKQAATPTSRPTASSTTVVVGADGRVVSLPTFSGYQVKVKYVTPSIMVASQSPTSSGSGSTTTSQAHIPMKKRHYDVSTFATPSSKPKAKALSDSVPKMTSLYVGASAAVLGLSNSESGLSTSDTESERDSPMFPEHARTSAKLRHHHQWRRSTAKEWTEYRGRGPEAAKRSNFISYDPPKPSPTSSSTASSASLSSAQNPKQSGESRPKATFSLWDRKHHAITMTTATNWRGKQQQQLLTSKSKNSPPSPQMSNPTSQQPSSTQVCYTTLREPSKPTVPTTLVVGSQASQSPQGVATEYQLATSSPYELAAKATTPQPAKQHQSQVEIGTVIRPAAPPRSSVALQQLAQLTAPRNVTTRTHFVQSAAKVHVTAPTATFPSVPGSFPQGQAALQAVPVSLPSNHVAYQIVPPNFMTQGVVISDSGSRQHAPPAVNAPAMGYLLPAQPQQEQKSMSQSHSSAGDHATSANIVAAPAGNMPFMIPVGYVMYPGNMPVAQHGVQLASIQPPSAKVLTAAQPELMPVSCAQIVYQTMPSGAVKRSATPVLVTERGRTRVGSADSAGSSTISADSIDTDKREAPKRQRMSPKDQPTLPAAPALPPGQLLAPSHGGAQLMFPGNPRFVVANNGAAIPINLLGYPFASHHYESGSMQTVQMASAAQGASGQVWSINQGMGFQLAPAAGHTQQSMTSPVTLQLMPTAQPAKTS